MNRGEFEQQEELLDLARRRTRAVENVDFLLRLVCIGLLAAGLIALMVWGAHLLGLA